MSLMPGPGHHKCLNEGIEDVMLTLPRESLDERTQFLREELPQMWDSANQALAGARIHTQSNIFYGAGRE